MDIQHISAVANAATESDPPVELILAQQRLLKLKMYAAYSPRSAQYLSECIAYELERAEKILLERMRCPEVDRQRKAIVAARNALDTLNLRED